MMNWKKNVFSYVMWAVYTLVTVCALAMLARAASDTLGGPFYAGVLAAAGYLLLMGCAVYLFRRFLAQRGSKKDGSVTPLLVAEAVLAVLFLIVGLVLRLQGLPQAQDPAMYFETVKVAEGQAIPFVPHGASYIYLQLLHVVFVFLGNKVMGGVWLQLVLQLVGAFVLSLGVRKLAGPVASLSALLFLTCSDFFVDMSLVLSPAALFFLLFAVCFDLLAACADRELFPLLFLFTGIFLGALGYLDAGGFFLLLIGMVVVMADYERKPSLLRRTAALLLLLLGSLLGFCGLLLVFSHVGALSPDILLNAWLALYRPGEFSLAGTQAGVSAWEVLRLLFMAFGIFGFWCRKKSERMGVWVLVSCSAAAAEGFGMFTEAVPASVYLYFFLAVLTGLGLQECFRRREISKDAASEGAVKENVALQNTAQKEGVPEKAVAEGEAQEQTAIDQVSTETAVSEPEPSPEKPGPTRYIENPLPLPKPHERRVMDYDRRQFAPEDDFDHPVKENDDYDIL